MDRGVVLHQLKRGSFVVGLALLLSGCEALSNSSLFQGFQRAPQQQDTSPLSEQGLGKLAKGDLLGAQALFDRALSLNPGDVHALIGKGMIFQQTGQPTQARAAYEAVLALRPGDAAKMVIWANARAQPVREIASVNLALLESQGVANRIGAPQPSVPRQLPGQPSQPSFGPPPIINQAPQAAAAPIVSTAENNVVSRFETLRGLRDEGLITPEEYNVRRRVNIGALLPLTSPPPAAGLDRSVPSAAQISQRLRAISRALELRAITVRQHGAERTTIIDGLMPSAPRAIANPGAPPKGLLEAADAVRRLERLTEVGLITSDEAAKERAAIEKILTPAPPPAPKASAAPTGGPKALEAPAAASGPQPAVHIASYRSRASANRGWAQLRRAHRALLGNLKPEITRVNLPKGTFYRLIAGPLKSQAEASRICSRLKSRRQYCEPAFTSG